VTETNGIAVTLSSAELRIIKRNRFAKAISYFVVHVPSGSNRMVSVSFLPVKLCNSSHVIDIPLKGSGKGFSDYLLGADIQKEIILHGKDEIGRDIHSSVWLSHNHHDTL